jgi:Arm DNA-binding domain
MRSFRDSRSVCRPRGRQTFTLHYRHRRRMRRIGLGRYPDVLLEKARKIAIQHRGRIFNGADPAGEKKTEHAQDDNTVQAVYELYRSRKEKVLRSWSEVRRILEKEVLPTVAGANPPASSPRTGAAANRAA